MLTRLNTILPRQNSSPHPTWRLSLSSLNTRVPCLCHIFSRTLNANSPFLLRLVFPQFLQRSTLPFLIPSCNSLQQAPPCFPVSSIFLSLQTFGVCAHNVRSTSSRARVATFGVESSAHQINHKISTSLMSTILSTSTSKE